MKWIVNLLMMFSFVHAVAWGAPVMTDSTLSVRLLVSGLSSPTTMAFIGVDDFLVLQKNDGKVRRVVGSVLQSAAVLDVNVDSQSERGLLGIAVHPNFPSPPYVYLYFTEGSSGDGSNNGVANRVYRFSWNGSVLTTPGTLIADLPITSGPNHDGGVMTFGPDGKLYIVIGDLNRDGRLQNNPSGAAPDDTSVLLRLNDDGTVPSDNPFFSQGGNVAKYFAYGIRNSFGMAFDPVMGKLWNTENGPDQYDEINIVEAGFNSGWRKLMGPDSRNANGIADLFALAGAHYADPEFSWLEPIGVTAIAFPSQLLGAGYQNSVLVGDVNNGNLYRLPLNQARDGFTLSGGLADLVADNVAEREALRVGMNFGGITDIKLGPDGRVYVVSIGDGAVYVVEPASGINVGTGALPDGEIGLSYAAPLDITGGNPPFLVTLVKGSLPLGLNLVGTSITGIPSQSKTAKFTLRLTDQVGTTVTKGWQIKIFPNVTISNSRLPNGRVGRNYRADLNGSRGKPPHTWSLVTGVLPVGLVFEPATGKITGTPTAPGSFDLTFLVTDALGATKQKAFTLAIQ